MRRTSLNDVAQRASVSATTVSFVLNGRTREMGIGAATSARVLLAAKELGYRPNRIAGSLARGKTRSVGVVVPNLGANIVARLVDGIEAACSARDHRVILAQARGGIDAAERQAQLLLDHRVDALIGVSTRSPEASERRWLAEAAGDGLPCILVDAPDLTGRVDSVVSDDRGGAQEAVAHLVWLGHRRIAHLAANGQFRLGRERLAGYQACLAAARLPVASELVVEYRGEGQAYDDALERLLTLPQPPTAIFAGSDYLAADVLRFALARALRIPGDVAVVGFGDVPLAHNLGLTTVNHPAHELGARAVERLFARLAAPELPVEQITLPTRLVVRDTCGGLSTIPSAHHPR